jgi:hypothetical protein
MNKIRFHVNVFFLILGGGGSDNLGLFPSALSGNVGCSILGVSYSIELLLVLLTTPNAGATLTLLKYPKELFTSLRQGQVLNEPFSTIIDKLQIQNKFVKN